MTLKVLLLQLFLLELWFLQIPELRYRNSNTTTVTFYSYVKLSMPAVTQKMLGGCYIYNGFHLILASKKMLQETIWQHRRIRMRQLVLLTGTPTPAISIFGSWISASPILVHLTDFVAAPLLWRCFSFWRLPPPSLTLQLGVYAHCSTTHAACPGQSLRPLRWYWRHPACSVELFGIRGSDITFGFLSSPCWTPALTHSIPKGGFVSTLIRI